MGQFCASGVRPAPLHVFPACRAEIGPFSVRIRSLPLLPSKLIGPFTAVISASPEKYFKLIGPLWARAVSLPSTSYREIGPFIVSKSTDADFGVRMSR